MLHWSLIVLFLTLSLPAAGHALLFKRDPRSALGWIIICLMFPLGGPLSYFLFGVNRIRTRARKLLQNSQHRLSEGLVPDQHIQAFQVPAPLDEIARMSDALNRRPLIMGNRVDPLENGETAYPAMLAAIAEARESVYLTTYVFGTDRTGRGFIDALAAAHGRGVDVRVILDGVGEWYSIPRAGTLLKRKGVPMVRFLPPRLFPPALRINLRNHRKILVADGTVAFVGGMNIGDSHLADVADNPRRISDLHFRLRGPIVSQIEHVFLEDWRFCTGEDLRPRAHRTELKGKTICRAVVDGPNVSVDRLDMLLVCAVSSARRTIAIMTPYFLPSTELIAALQAAALRGVAVTILLPGRNNLPFVHWASFRVLPQLLAYGVRVFFHPPPFVHTKLIIVDQHYAQVGSANIDPRSLRLNFELMVEIYGRAVRRRLAPHFQKRLEAAAEITPGDLEKRSLPVKLRDACCWLFSPYL